MSLIIPANSLAGGGYEIDNSLRFNSGSSDYLNRTPSGGNYQISTFSGWVKRSILGTQQHFFSFSPTDNNQFNISFSSDNTLQVYSDDNPTTQILIRTNRVFRDVSAWYHVFVAYDTTQGTASNRVKIYINGIQETSFSTATYPSLSANLQMNGNVNLCTVGTYRSPYFFYNGYLSEFNWIDGQALTPTDFGEFDADSGVWKPIAYSGTYGTNGFFLEFKDSSALGDDTSGEGNNFTVNNLTSIDQTTDTPTNNFATYNPLINKSSGVPTMSNGNLTLVTNACEFGSVSSIGVSQGKWYCELKWDSGLYAHIGITGDPITLSANASPYAGVTADSWGWNYGGTVQNSGSVIATYSSFATSNILGIALDLTNNKLYFSKNGIWENSADPSAGTNGISITASNSVAEGNYFIFIGNGSTAGNATISANFGNPPFTITTGNADANDYGNFEYEVPAGYYALCTNNLAEFG
jgi:hypothetical protein